MILSHSVKHDKHIKKLLQSGQQKALEELLQNLSSLEIATALIPLDVEQHVEVLRILPKKIASEILFELSDHSKMLTDIAEQLSIDELVSIISEMPGDNATDFVAILDERKANEILEHLPNKDSEEIATLLQYNEESAGGIMNPYVISVQKDQKVEEAIASIQKYIQEQEEFQQFYTVYVVDEYQHLIGTISVTVMLLADRSANISGLMNPDVVAVDVELDQEAVVRVVQEYNLVVVPVIDRHLRLVGRVTIDDLVDVIYEEHQEDIAQIVGMGNEEVLEPSIIRSSRDRFPWLLLGLAGGFLTATIMSSYENLLANLPQSAYFIPLIAALGGNIGIQSSSLVVRGLATGEIHPSDLLLRLWRELRVGLINGILCAVILTGMSWYLTKQWVLGITTGFALVLVVGVAATVGVSVPMFLKRLQIDPALATGPFITTANDMIGITIYFGVTFKMWELYFVH